MTLERAIEAGKVLGTPFDWGIAKYVGRLETAVAEGLPMHDYQQTLDTLPG